MLNCQSNLLIYVEQWLPSSSLTRKRYACWGDLFAFVLHYIQHCPESSCWQVHIGIREPCLDLRKIDLSVAICTIYGQNKIKRRLGSVVALAIKVFSPWKIGQFKRSGWATRNRVIIGSCSSLHPWVWDRFTESSLLTASSSLARKNKQR